MVEKQKRSIILIVAIVAVSGVVHRINSDIGYIATMLTLIYYLFSDIRRAVYYLKNFKQVATIKQVKAGTWVAMSIIVVSGFATVALPYFLILVLLASDYLIYDYLGRDGGR